MSFSSDIISVRTFFLTPEWLVRHFTKTLPAQTFMFFVQARLFFSQAHVRAGRSKKNRCPQLDSRVWFSLQSFLLLVSQKSSQWLFDGWQTRLNDPSLHTFRLQELTVKYRSVLSKRRVKACMFYSVSFLLMLASSVMCQVKTIMFLHRCLSFYFSFVPVYACIWKQAFFLLSGKKERARR